MRGRVGLRDGRRHVDLLHRRRAGRLLPHRRPATLSRLAKKDKTVNRIYGGALSHAVVRERIVRAFLIEEQKIVKKVVKSQAAAAAAAAATK